MTDQKHKLPEMTPVKSSNLAEVGHDGEALYLRFRRNDGSPGALYRYPSADREVHDDLLAADSPGQHFRLHIKGEHAGERVDET